MRQSTKVKEKLLFSSPLKTPQRNLKKVPAMVKEFLFKGREFLFPGWKLDKLVMEINTH
jgi:hypothetical protein